jgi:hypothetical protein
MPILLILAGLAILLLQKGNNSTSTSTSTSHVPLTTSTDPDSNTLRNAPLKVANLTIKNAGDIKTAVVDSTIAASVIIPPLAPLIAPLTATLGALSTKLFGGPYADIQRGYGLVTSVVDNVNKTGVMTAVDAGRLEQGRVLMQSREHNKNPMFHLEDFEDWGLGGLIYTAERISHGKIKAPYVVTSEDLDRFPPPSSAATSAAIVDAVNGKV